MANTITTSGSFSLHNPESQVDPSQAFESEACPSPVLRPLPLLSLISRHFFRLGGGGVASTAPPLPRRRLSYFRWFQYFRVGFAVAFPTVGASASQSSDEPEQHQKSATVSHEMSGLNWKPFVYGGLASIVAEFGTFPVDLTKTRLQVQGQSIDVRFKEIKYRGMFHALFRIYKEEGILALYSGIAPALLRQASYGTIKIGIYQSLKRLFVERLEGLGLLDVWGQLKSLSMKLF